MPSGVYKRTETHKQAISLARKGERHSESTKLKMSKAKKGKKLSEKHKLKLSEAKKKYYANGGKPWNYIDGARNRDIHSLSNPQYVEWRTNVFTRDDWKCKMANENCGGRMEAHHILLWRDYPELRYQINNGITLCHAHHPRKRAEEKLMIPVFQGLLGVSRV